MEDSMPLRPIRVIVADDHPIVVSGILAQLAEYEHIRVLGVAKSFEQALKLLHEHQHVDVLVLDLNGMGEPPISMVQQLHLHYPLLGILVFSSLVDLAPELLKAGVRGYMVKEDLTRYLVDSIIDVAQGWQSLTPMVREYLSQSQNLRKEKGLSPRELTILKLMAHGKGTLEIAAEMAIDPRTVQNHLSTIRTKINCFERTQLVEWYRTRYGADTV